MPDFDKQTIDFKCPECGFYNKATLKQVRLQDVIICRGCKKNIHLQDKNKSVSKMVHNLNQTMKNLGKALKS